MKEAFKKLLKAKTQMRVGKWLITEDRGQLVIRHDGVEYYSFTFHSGINYEYPERVLGISPEEQKLINKD